MPDALSLPNKQCCYQYSILIDKDSVLFNDTIKYRETIFIHPKWYAYTPYLIWFGRFLIWFRRFLIKLGYHVRLTCLRLHRENQSARHSIASISLKCWGLSTSRSVDASGNCRAGCVVDWPTTATLCNCRPLDAKQRCWFGSHRVRVGAWARGRVGAKQVAAPESVCATPHKILRNLINRLSRDPNLDSTTCTITKIKTWSWCRSHKTYMARTLIFAMQAQTSQTHMMF